jgi:uncharacterized protein
VVHVRVEDAVGILRRAGCSAPVIEHCQAVRRIALRLAREIERRGVKINVELVGDGAALHDIGRARTHGIAHGIEGGRLLREMGLERLAPFAENHLGGGIPAEEAAELGLPPRDFVPVTLEEKVVAYADKLVEGSRVIPFERSVEEFRRKLGERHPAIGRLLRLHEEMKSLLGSDPELLPDEAPWEGP